jgi:hypothetical protein
VANNEKREKRERNNWQHPANINAGGIARWRRRRFSGMALGMREKA